MSKTETHSMRMVFEGRKMTDMFECLHCGHVMHCHEKGPSKCGSCGRSTFDPARGDKKFRRRCVSGE